jgi:hypothetical protein
MLGKFIVVATMFVFSIAAAAENAQPRVNLSASDIVSKNVAARGGLQAWRSVHAMKWTGKLGVGGNQRATISTPLPEKKGAALTTDPRTKDEVQLLFVMEMQRPRKVRYELQFNKQNAVQTYDGVNGWKLRPFLNRLEVEPFTQEELKASSLQSDLDGSLVDYAAKGTRIELEGIEKVDNRDAYKLKLTMKDGHSIYEWIDAQTFLETKTEGVPRRLDGVEHPVEVYYSDYRPVNGLQIPFILETRVLQVTHAASSTGSSAIPVERIVLNKVEVNPILEESLFSKPNVQDASLVRHQGN